MKIAVRMDDITDTMDRAKWERADQILKKCHIAPLLGVVPDNGDSNLIREKSWESEEAYWDFLKDCQKEGCTIALHGCHHVYDGKKGGLFPLNDFSEFAGLPYEIQYERLSHGKEILEGHGIVPQLFMAPAHAYDRNTLRALKKLNLCKVTDGFGKEPYQYMGITFYPIAHHLARQFDKSGYTTCVLHTNTMEEKDFRRLEEMVSGCDMISYSDYMQIKPKQAGVMHRVIEYGMAKSKYFLVKIRS